MGGDESGEVGLGREDEDEGDEEDEAGDCVEDYGADHGFGDLGCWLLDFFAHSVGGMLAFDRGIEVAVVLRLFFRYGDESCWERSQDEGKG